MMQDARCKIQDAVNQMQFESDLKFEIWHPACGIRHLSLHTIVKLYLFLIRLF